MLLSYINWLHQAITWMNIDLSSVKTNNIWVRLDFTISSLITTRWFMFEYNDIFISKLPTANQLIISKSWENFSNSSFNSNNITKSQFYTCHSSSTAVTCAKLWPDRITIFHMRTTHIFIIFGLWVHKSLLNGSYVTWRYPNTVTSS